MLLLIFRTVLPLFSPASNVFMLWLNLQASKSSYLVIFQFAETVTIVQCMKFKVVLTVSSVNTEVRLEK